MKRLGILICIVVCLFGIGLTVATAAPEEQTKFPTFTCEGFNFSFTSMLQVLATFNVIVEAGDQIEVEIEWDSGTGTGLSSIDFFPGPSSGTQGIPNSLSYDVESDGVVQVQVQAAFDPRIDPPVVVTLSCGEESDGGPSSPGIPCEFDTRTNDRPDKDCGAPIAVYFTSVFFDIYGINPVNGNGQLVLRWSVSDDELTDDPPLSNELIGQGVNPYTGRPILVYRLTTGEIRIDTQYADGKPYIIVFDLDSPEEVYHIAA